MLVSTRFSKRAGGTIHIKKKNRGKFTASAKRAGRGVQEHVQSVLSSPNASPLQKKRANFARNAAKWKKPEGGKLTTEEARQPVSNEFPDNFPVLSQQLPGIGGQLNMFSKRDSANFTPIYNRMEQFFRSDAYDPYNTTNTQKQNLGKVSKAFVPPTRRGRAYLDKLEVFNQPTEISEGQKTLFENLPNITDDELAKVLDTDFSDLKDSNIFKKAQKAIQLKPKDVSIGDALDINNFFRSDLGKATYPEVYIQAANELSSKKQGGKMRTKFSKGGQMSTMLSEKKRVPVNDLMKFAKGGSTKNLGTFRPSPDYKQFSGNPDAIEDYGTINRTEYEDFTQDTTKIPAMRGKVNDAAWLNILNEFKGDPSLQGLQLGNIQSPFGSGDRITGRFQGNLPALRPIAPKPSRFSEINPSFENRGNTPKVNAYNYSKGRPYSGIEKFTRKTFRGGGSLDAQGFIEPGIDREGPLSEAPPLPEIDTPDQTVPTDNTSVQQNRPTFFDGNLTDLQYTDQRYGLSPILSDKFNQGLINTFNNPDGARFQTDVQKIAANRLLTDEAPVLSPVPPSLLPESQRRKRKRGGKLSKFSKTLK